MKDNFQVSLAALFGFGSPGLNLVLDVVNPLLQALLLLGQVGVAAVTIWFIYRKAKNVTPKRRKKKDSPPHGL